MCLPDDTDSRLLLITNNSYEREDTWKLASDHLENSVTKGMKPDSLEALKLFTPTVEQGLMQVIPSESFPSVFIRKGKEFVAKSKTDFRTPKISCIETRPRTSHSKAA